MSKPLPFFPCRCCSSPCNSLTQPIVADFALPLMRHEYPGVGEVEYLAIYHYKYLTFLLRLGYLSPSPRHTWSESLGNLALLSTRVLPQVHEISRQACLPDRDHHLHLAHLGLRPLHPQRARVSHQIFFVFRSFRLPLKYRPSDVSIRSSAHPAILLVFPGHANGTWPVLIRPTCLISALLSMASPTLSKPALLRIQRE